MNRRTDNKIILVTRTTRMAELKARFATKAQARFYVTRLGGDFAEYESEEDVYQRAIATAQTTLARLGRVHLLQRDLLPNYVFGPQDLVVALGQDGLVANTLKYLDSQPVIGVNPDPDRWDGRLLPFTVDELNDAVMEHFAGRSKIRHATMARVKLNTGSTLDAVNDFFIGARTHVSARYRIEHGGMSENHSSSGVVVSTGLGSTGWLKSLITGANAIARVTNSVISHEATAHKSFPLPRGTRANKRPEINTEFEWDAAQLVFTVREPFPSNTTSNTLVLGRITPDQPLTIESHMGENGVIFSDGIEQDFLEFGSGTTATVTIADKKGTLIY